MSLYDIIYGKNPAIFYILPMIGAAEDFPRFRDCFAGKLNYIGYEDGFPIRAISDDDVITVHTRVGGGNREEYQNEIDALRKHPHYLEDYDDDFDSTYASFIFSVPEHWRGDYAVLVAGRWWETSEAYRKHIEAAFPGYVKLLTWNR